MRTRSRIMGTWDTPLATGINRSNGHASSSTSSFLRFFSWRRDRGRWAAPRNRGGRRHTFFLQVTGIYFQKDGNFLRKIFFPVRLSYVEERPCRSPVCVCASYRPLNRSLCPCLLGLVAPLRDSVQAIFEEKVSLRQRVLLVGTSSRGRRPKNLIEWHNKKT